MKIDIKKIIQFQEDIKYIITIGKKKIEKNLTIGYIPILFVIYNLFNKIS